MQSDQPEFSGTAAPGSVIRLALSPAAKPMNITLAGVTTANSTRPVVADHAPPAPQRTVPHARDSLLSHADHPTGVRHRSNPAAGTPGRRRTGRISETVRTKEIGTEPKRLRLAIEDASLHHQFHLAQGLDVAGWVPLDGNQVGQETVT